MTIGHLPMDVHRLRESEVFKELGSSPAGLSVEEAQRRLAQYGLNSLQAVRGTPLAIRFLRQFTHFLAILLWLAAGLAFLADVMKPGEGMRTLGWAIVGVIFINAAFSFVQEFKAERAVQALRRLLPATAWAIRAGQTVQVSRKELVPGDLLLIEEGEQVPADARLIEALQLRVDVSSLTGEARPRTRHPRAVTSSEIKDPLDAPNLIFAGTTIVSGRGRAVIYATGMRTEFGRIAHLATTVAPGLSPLQREIARVTHVVAVLSAVMGAVFFLIGLATGLGFWVSAIFGIGIIVANVPEGLLPTVTLALAMGSQRMARRNAIIKHLTSVETLGCTTVICTDKTGTLTENRMRVTRLAVGDRDVEVRDAHLLVEGRHVTAGERTDLEPLLRAVTLCTNARVTRRPDGTETVTGDPTEVALLEFARQHGVPEHEVFPRMGELPFDADRKRMTTIHWVYGDLMAYVKGAPELVLPICSRSLAGGEERPMASEARDALLAQSRHYAGQAYRVLAVAQRGVRRGPRKLEVDTVERDLTFLGLVAMVDPPHREVPGAVARCRRAGIRVIMITGDHPLTAVAVARLIGLLPSETPTEAGATIEGSRLDAMSDENLRALLATGADERKGLLFARMTPRHKMRIVSILEEMGEVVAVTGDGVNDAPALKKADIGIAMGVAGTDVAKETADMILVDDNFATIVNGIEEGRTVYANVRKFVTYVLTHNVPEVMPYLGYGLFGLPLALTIPQILAVDLGTDLLPALALGAERPHPGTMDVPPRPRTERLLNVPLLLRVYGFLGLIEAAVAMTLFFSFLLAHGWSWGRHLTWTDPLYRQATTVTLAAIVIAQVANVFACRSERISVLRLGFFSNAFILWGIAVELALLASIVYTPLGNLIFGTHPLPATVWPILIIGAILLLFAEEIRKMIVARLRRPTQG